MAMPKKPMPILHFSLDDIFDGIKCTPTDASHIVMMRAYRVIRSNIIYILKREKLWNKDLSIIFPYGATASLNLSEEMYQFDFMIWKKSISGYVASGTCYGSGAWLHNTFEIYNMELELHSYSISELKDKELVIFS